MICYILFVIVHLKPTNFQLYYMSIKICVHEILVLFLKLRDTIVSCFMVLCYWLLLDTFLFLLLDYISYLYNTKGKNKNNLTASGLFVNFLDVSNSQYVGRNLWLFMKSWGSVIIFYHTISFSWHGVFDYKTMTYTYYNLIIRF